MSALEIFDGSQDVNEWAAVLTAKLTSKGYKTYLQDANRPAQGAEQTAWVAQADKAMGVAQTYLASHTIGNNKIRLES